MNSHCDKCRLSAICLGTPVELFTVAFCKNCGRFAAYAMTGRGKRASLPGPGQARSAMKCEAVYLGLLPEGQFCRKLSPRDGFILGDREYCGNCRDESGGVWLEVWAPI